MYIKGGAVRLDICWAAPNILGVFFHPIKFPPLFTINFITVYVAKITKRGYYVSYAALLYK